MDRMIATNIIVLNALILGIILLVYFVKELVKVMALLVLAIVGELRECIVMVVLKHFKFDLTDNNIRSGDS